MNNNNGGPAFPQPNGFNKGMTLRDWLAGHVIAQLAREHPYTLPIDPMLAEFAYAVADSMIRARVQ